MSFDYTLGACSFTSKTKIMKSFFAVFIAGLMSLPMLMEKQVIIGQDKENQDTPGLLRAKIMATGIAANPVITQYQSYPSGTNTLYLVQYNEGATTGLTAVIETENLDEPGGKLYECTGNQCHCLVGISVGSNGQYQISCNCTSCVMNVYEIPN